MSHKVNTVFFSATGTTSKIVKEVCSGMGANDVSAIDLLSPVSDEVLIARDEIAVFGVPVYSGRVPEFARKSIERFRGEGTMAIVVCVYGNRDFDDALLELTDIVGANGFKVVSAAAFVAQHSIFPDVAKGRPDDADVAKARDFGRQSMQLIAEGKCEGKINVKGNRPYRDVSNVPLTPSVTKDCVECGKCAELCPMQAISKEDPKKVDKDKCMACGLCIATCPAHARKFTGLFYSAAALKFSLQYSERKEPYIVYGE